MPESPAPDLFEAGRTDPPHSLRDRLASAAPRYAEGALENPALDEALVEVMLRNAGLPGELLQRVATDARFRKSDAIKRALVVHRKTPPPISMQLVKFLTWRELLELMEDRQIPLPLRSLAEQTVAERLGQIPPSEQALLARDAGRGLLAGLLRSRNPRVIQELLINPRLVETDVIRLAHDPTVPAEMLGTIARHQNWNTRPPVRAALVENLATPIQDALRLLPMLSTPELRNLARNVRLRPPVRNEAQKLLDARKQ
jgi:hypothetical protein